MQAGTTKNTPDVDFHTRWSMQVFIRPQAVSLRVPRPETSVAATFRPRRGPPSFARFHGNQHHANRTTLSAVAGSSSASGSKPEEVGSADKTMKDGEATKLNRPAWLAAEVLPLTQGRKHGLALRRTWTGKSQDFERHYHVHKRRATGRSWRQVYGSETQLQRLCKQYVGVRALPHDVVSDWNLLLSMLEWEVDTDHAMSPDHGCVPSA